MTWVICQSPSSGEEFGINEHNVKRAVRKGRVTSVEFVDGTPALVINMTLDQWIAAVAGSPPQQIM